MDPQQELFSALLVSLRTQGYDVYDGAMPSENAEYPFIYLADSQQVDDFGNKTAVWGNVFQTIHVWHNEPQKRGTVSGILSHIKQIARNLTETAHFSWHIRNIDQRILADTTTARPLVHGVLELEYKFN